MSNAILKIIISPVFLLIMGSVYSQGVPQVYNKLGDSPFNINNSAALEVESTTRGFLPPRMTMKQRNDITLPAEGLIIWCLNCNSSTTPASGVLCVYAGDRWVSLPLLPSVPPTLSTGKRGDAVNAPIRLSNTSATISGTLSDSFGTAPTETGIVYREIIGNDYTTFPVLALDSGANTKATAPDYKVPSLTTVTATGGKISTDINLNSATGNIRPYYFRTFAKNAAGIGYGNTVIFNVAPPKISDPIVTNGNTLFPAFAGTLIVNAGTPGGTITEYGYYSGSANLPTTNKVVLSSAASIEALNTTLDAQVFTADPVINLNVNDYVVKTTGTSYFRYYVVAGGVTTYSNVVAFSPPLPPILTTGKNGDVANAPVRLSNTSATITGTLVNTYGIAPTETGIVYREIIGNDYAAFPILVSDASGTNTTATAPDYKIVTPTAVTTAGGKISIDINLNSATGNTRPYYFRSFAKNAAGIGYGNTMIFNVAPPKMSDPIVTNGNTSLPAFAGTLIVNAGTPKGTITEYGYYSGNANLPTTNKVVLSSAAGIEALNTTLDAQVFTADPVINLNVNDYVVKTAGTSYFRYYVVAGGVTTYSNVVAFSPPFPPLLTTGKNGDIANAPVKLSNTSATITGTLVNTYGMAPTETGIVYREIIGNDYAAFPTLASDVSGTNTTATAPDYKIVTPTAVTTAGGKISMDINLNSATGNTRPYYFRTYAKNAVGIGYGNTMIFNMAPPKISDPIVTNENTMLPTFAGTLIVNAGTPGGTITEYGYCSGTANLPTTNKVVLSSVAGMEALNTALNTQVFTADPTINLNVSDYVVQTTGASYFRYYVVAGGVTTYSNVAAFSPPAPPSLTTGKNGDIANAPIRLSNTSATITGTLVNTYGSAPTETGIVYREIIGNDYAAFPTLASDASGTNITATAPNYKVPNPTAVTTAGGKISMDINLISATTNTRPYYFRTYAKNAAGIGYGNTAIFNTANIATISQPVITNETTINPVFTATLTVNAGTPSNTISEYGYYSSTTTNSPTATDNKVVLSATAAGTTALAVFNTTLNSDNFTADPTMSLTATYNFTGQSSVYFKFYVIANGITTTSPVAKFDPPKAKITIVNCDVASTGALSEGVPVASGVSQTILISVDVPGPYDAITTSSGGVTFSSGNGVFLTSGQKNIVLNATGTPTYTANTYSFTIVGSEKFFYRSVKKFISPTSNGGAIINIISEASQTGNLTVNIPIPTYTPIIEKLNITWSKTGTVEILTNTQAGIYFVSPLNNAVYTGSPPVYSLSGYGTPNQRGTFTFTTNTTPSFSFNWTIK